MSEKRIQLALRRERLIAQAGQQRTTLARSVQTWRGPLAIADQGLSALRYLKRNPLWLVGGAAVFVVLRRRSAGKWLRRGWVAWSVVKRLRG
jgi:YqjK-like protein